ncbi:MAG: sporulation integral membrane protein YtvI [Thermoflexaceae bacterium]|nr:sporulation integral membrane protein YtvI [Thermoflexaceae bacterium]
MNEQEKAEEEKIERRKRFIVNVLYWGIIAVFVLIGIKVTEPVLVPLIIAFIIAWILHKPIDWLEQKIHIKKSVIAFLVVILAYSIIGVLLTRIVMRSFVALRDFFSDLPGFYDRTIEPALNTLFAWFENICEMIDPMIMESIEESSDKIMEYLADFATGISSGAVSWISGKALSIPSILMKTLITLVVTVFITMDFHDIVNFIYRQMPEKTKKYLVEIKNYTGGTLLKCLKSYLIIMLITFTELLIGLSILRIPNALVLAAIIAVIDILPVLGTGGILIPWAFISAITGNIRFAIGLLVLYVIILVIRNIIEPKIVGSQVGLHPVLTLASMFVGLHFFGIIGMFALPITLSVIKNLNERGMIHIFK